MQGGLVLVESWRAARIAFAWGSVETPWQAVSRSFSSASPGNSSLCALAGNDDKADRKDFLDRRGRT